MRSCDPGLLLKDQYAQGEVRQATPEGQTCQCQSESHSDGESGLTVSSHLLDVGGVRPQGGVAFGGGEPFLIGAVWMLVAAAGVSVTGGCPRGRRGRRESRGGGGRKEGGRRRRSANRWGRGRTVSTLGEMTTGMTSLLDDVTGSGVIILQVRCISTDPQVPLCFRSAEEEAGWRGRSRAMSSVEQPSIKESSLLSSDLSEAGGGALSAERKGKVS